MVTLQASKLFSHLPAAELRTVREAVEEHHYEAGQQIFKEGDPGDGMYVVKSGTVEISTALANGQRLVFARVPPGDVFGEMAVLDSQPRSAGATAGTEASVYFVPRETLLELLQRAPELALNLLQEIVERFREFNRQYLRNVLQAERMALVGRFASAIVHDLKNPLTIINMAAELGCSSDKPDLRQEARHNIASQVSRITCLINDILDFTRGTPPAPSVTPENYGRFVTEQIEELRSELASSGVTVEFNQPPPEMILAIDRRQLGRVLQNLLTNARDAMPGGGAIRLDFEVKEKEVITRVRDSGGGIAPEIAERLFEPFASFGKAHGTGLGLSICQRIVRDHGGDITAHNHPAGGAVFTFILPRR